jgi:signal transduction histidine kinase
MNVGILGRACGLLVAIGGLVAIAGGRAAAMPDESPLFVPLAFALALAGAGLAAAHRPRVRRVLGAATLVAAVALVAPATSAELAGEPLPRSVVVLFAVGCGLVLAHTRLGFLADGFGLAVGVLAAGAIVANATGVEGSGDDPLNAAPVAEVVAWLALGAGMLFANTGARAGSPPGWRPAVIAGVATALLSGLLFQALSLREQEQMGNVLEVASRQIRGEIAVELRERRSALSLLAAEWEGRFIRLRGLWESDVRLILSRSPGLSRIEWVDASGEVGWNYPKEQRPASLTVPASAVADGRPRSFALGPERLADGRLVFRMLVPVSRTDADEGWLSGVFVASDLFAGISRRLPEGWVVAIHAGDVQLHRSPDAAAEWAPGRSTLRTIETLRGLPLRVTVGASPALVAERSSRLPAAVLFTGLALSVLLGVALRQWLVSRSLARHLESRVAERTALLAQSNEGLRSFASFLSHELRQPVNAQTLWTDLLESDYGTDLDEQGRRGISEVRRLAHRMGELIEGQLELFALSSANVAFTSVDLGQVLEEVARDLKTELHRSGALIEWERMPVVSGDAAKLHQLFRNLVDNSIKYRRPDAPPSVHVSAHIRGEKAEIVYRDEGQGFPANASERIFQIGTRLDGEGSPGHGLGLAMCRAIAERHGGRLTAESAPGRGATFRIELPLAFPPPRA